MEFKCCSINHELFSETKKIILVKTACLVPMHPNIGQQEIFLSYVPEKEGELFELDETYVLSTKLKNNKVHKVHKVRKNTFKRKLETIEAFQMTKKRRWDNIDWPQWLHKAWSKDQSEIGAVYPNGDAPGGTSSNLVVRTKEGATMCPINNYIINIDEELQSCDPDLFEKTYQLQ